tara:strand:- start:101 stop:1141 length:1041 start_codon:yes stop_codon:yes gene_type:complete
MAILITGGAGYIGSHTILELQELNYDVIVIDNFTNGHEEVLKNVLKVPYVEGNIGDKILVKNLLSGNHEINKGKTIEAIIHFAAFAHIGESCVETLKYYKNNIVNNLIFLEEVLSESKLRNYPIPVVFSSSCATYGLPDKLPISESNFQNPTNPYGWTKLVIERALKDFSNAHNLPSIIFRYFNAAGCDPKARIGENHNPETHLIPLILQTISGKRPYFEIYGDDYPTFDGTCIRDFIHVNDLAKAHILGLKKLLNNKEKNNIKSLAFNLGNDIGYSIKEVIQVAEKVTGKSLNFKVSKRRGGDPPELIASSTKARDLLKWDPQRSDLETIIKDAWVWEKKLNSTL